MGVFVSVLGAVLQFLGLAPWLAIVAALAAVTVVLAQRVSWVLAFALSVMAITVGFVLFIRFAPLIPTEFGLQITVVLLVVSLLAWSSLLRLRAVRLPRAGAAIASLSAAAFMVVLSVIVAVTDGTRLSWAMRGDAVWNTITARMIAADHGVTDAFSNPSPLTPSLMAAAISAGREQLDPAQWMQHDITRTATLWLLLIAMTSVLAATIAHHSLRKLGRGWRLAGTAGVSLLPLSWFVAGNSIEFGFYNATAALVILLCAWVAWQFGKSNVVAAVVLLALCTVGMLAAWAPLAIIPVGLTATVLLRYGLGKVRRFSRVDLTILAVSAAGVVAYIIAVTLQDLRREAAALGADGGTFALSPRQGAVLAAIVVAAIVLALVFLRNRNERGEALGILALIASGCCGLFYLLYQRVGTGLQLWGYYPAKFSWLICCVLLVIVAVGLIYLAAGLRGGLRGLVVVAGAFVALGALWMPLATSASLTSFWSVLFPAVGGPGEATTLLFSLSDPREKNLVASSVDDGLINGWLLQQQGTHSHDEIRGFAYTLDARLPEEFCRVAAVWGDGLVVHTSNEAIIVGIPESCPEAGITVTQ